MFPGLLHLGICWWLNGSPVQETQETQVQSLGQEDPLEKEWLPTPVFLPGKFHGQRSLAGYRPWGHNESDMNNWATSTFHIVLLITTTKQYYCFGGMRKMNGEFIEDVKAEKSVCVSCYLLVCVSICLRWELKFQWTSVQMEERNVQDKKEPVT